MTTYAQHRPATYDLTGLSQQQFDTMRQALIVLSAKAAPEDVYSDEFERQRLSKICALELIQITNEAVRQAKGEVDDDDQ